MSVRFPHLSALRAFAAAGRHLSFQRAAAELAVTPTAISHQIRRLEEDLGTPLFVRLTRKLALTEAGLALLPEVAGAFDRIGAALERIKATGDAGVLTISAITTFCFRWLVPRLPQFQAEHPKIEVRIEASPRLVDFVRDHVDVAIRHGLGNWPGLTSIKLFDDRITPLISPRLLAKGPPLKKPADVLDYPLLREEIPHSEWESWFSLNRVEARPRTGGLVFNSSQLAVQAAEGGLGIAIVNPDFFLDEIKSGRLVQPFGEIHDTGKSFHLVFPPAAANRPKVAAFRDWVLAEAATFRKRRLPSQPKRRKAPA
ncbi:MAG: transcriptional regulator GcvA [Rhodospirillaceae bacterium]|nr:transcriptional regulator GcvA [Rhodospirillaceae bacterium]